MITRALALLLSATVAQAQEPDWSVNWMDFRELVPAKMKTVLLSARALEPHRL